MDKEIIYLLVFALSFMIIFPMVFYSARSLDFSKIVRPNQVKLFYVLLYIVTIVVTFLGAFFIEHIVRLILEVIKR